MVGCPASSNARTGRAMHLERPGTLPLAELIAQRRQAMDLSPTSDIGSVTLEGLELGIDNLCRSYTTARPEELLGPVRRYRGAVDRLLDARATLAQRRQLMVLGGWVSLLAACVHVDLGQREAAYASRLTAQRIGTQTENGELTAWAFEIGAWQALVDGHYDEAVSLCSRGSSCLAPRAVRSEPPAASDRHPDRRRV